MNKNLSLFALCLILSIASCSCTCFLCPEGESDIIWRASITDRGRVDADMPVIVYKNGVLFVGVKNGQSVFRMFDKDNGTLLWEWSDFFRNPELVSVYGVYQYHNIMVTQKGPRIYSINLDSGQTVWRTNGTPDGGQYATGIGNSFFVSYDNKVFRGNVYTGAIEEITNFPASSTNIKTVASSKTIPFVQSDGDTVLAITMTKRLIPESTTELHLVLYNLTKRKQLYDEVLQDSDGDKKPLTSGDLPVLYKDRFYQAIGRSVQCNDLQTGKLLWRNDNFNGIFLASGLRIADGKIFAACEDVNLYALDAETGRELWKQRIAGTTTTPFYMNGVVYIASGGDGNFYALDANTGQIIWSKESPDLKNDSGAFFFGYVTGADGKVYVQSYRTAYCYKAAR